MASIDLRPAVDRPVAASRGRHARLLSAVTAGLIGGLLSIASSLAYAAIVFAGPFADDLGLGITLALFTGAVLGLIVAALSTVPSAIGNAQGNTAVVLGAIAVAIGELVPGPAQLATLLVVIAAASLSLGLSFLLLGAFRLGNTIRYIPFPVIGGFLGYVAWLLARGGVAAMTGEPVSLATLPRLVELDALGRCLPALVLAVALLVLQRRRRHALNVPVMLVVSLAGFWLVAWFAGTTPASLLEAGHVLAPLTPAQGWAADRLPSALAATDWATVLALLPKLAIVSVVAMITLLMNASTLEAASRRAVDLNRELITAGIGNLAAGLGGGLPGHHSVSAGLLPHYLGTQSRLVGLVSAAVCGATLAVGGPLLGFVPKLLIGLVLFYLALDLTIDLAVDRWPLVSRGERLVMLAVFATLVAVGFVEGIVLGIVAGLAVFAVNYARTGVVRAQGSGLAYASNVVRPPAQVSALEEVAEAIHVVRLQGFLFFGTAHRLLDEIGTQLAAARAVPLRFLVLDFARVTGADSSAIASFARLLDEAESRGFQILLAAVPPPVRALIDVVGRGVDLKLFADLDHCLEHAENELLAKAVPGGGPDGHEAAGDLAEVLADPMLRRRLLTYARPVTWRPGQTVIVQGELSNAMYFIERGRLTARLKLSQGGTVRVTTLLPGTVVGEIGCYLDLPRTLTLIAESTVTAWAIDREALERMRQKEPDLAADFHYRMVRLASSRLAALTRYLEHHDR